MKLLQGDCLELMNNISDKSIDMILCDPPYGITRYEWDKPIPFGPLWEQYRRIIKDNGAILLFSSQPFTTDLIQSNRKMFRYEIIWEKTKPTRFLHANHMPLKIHENICVFYKHLPTYHPQKRFVKRSDIGRKKISSSHTALYGDVNGYEHIEDGTRHPTDVIHFSSHNDRGAILGERGVNVTKNLTQKPVALLEYLIKTYTNSGELVLDNCMGSGSTGVACVNIGRDFIGMELDEQYFSVAKERIFNEKMLKLREGI